MAYADTTCLEFAQALASKAPTPGGGGASAAVGALGAALGSMVGNLTLGKKKYADVEAQIISLNSRAKSLMLELIGLVDADAEVFAPLARAYSIPKGTPGREEAMEKVLREACSVPIEIMAVCCRVIELLEEYAEIGSVMAISDVGCGAACCKAAIQAASLNVYINTKSMLDRAYAEQTEARADAMINEYCARADKVYEYVLYGLRG